MQSGAKITPSPSCLQVSTAIYTWKYPLRAIKIHVQSLKFTLFFLPSLYCSTEPDARLTEGELRGGDSIIRIILRVSRFWSTNYSSCLSSNPFHLKEVLYTWKVDNQNFRSFNCPKNDVEIFQLFLVNVVGQCKCWKSVQHCKTHLKY